MDINDVLQMSRMENQNQDLFEKEILRKGSAAASIVATVLATIFFVLQIILGLGINYALYAIVFSIPMTSFWVKYINLRKTHELVLAIGYTVLVLALSAGHISSLLASSTIM